MRRMGVGIAAVGVLLAAACSDRAVVGKCGEGDGGAVADCRSCAACTDVRGGLGDAGRSRGCPELSGGAVECRDCPDQAGRCQARADTTALPDCPVQPAACADCPEGSHCIDGHCYDCSEEGSCNALECSDDDNPCTLQVVNFLTDKCATALNPACEEPIRNLILMHRGASAYYGLWENNEANDGYQAHALKVGNQVKLEQPATPDKPDCCGPEWGVDPEGDGWCEADPDAFSTPAWRFLNFSVNGRHRYVYSFSEVGNGKIGEDLFVETATGDLDCDGAAVTFSLVGRFKDLTSSPYAHSSHTYDMLKVPSEIQYKSEGGKVLVVPAEWAVSQFNSGHRQGPALKEPANSFLAAPEETYFVRYREPMNNLYRIFRGAKHYYRLKKTVVGAPSCQVDPGDQAIMDQYSDKFPHYAPLMQAMTPIEDSCCKGEGPNMDGNDLCDWDVDIWTTVPWSNLGFVLTGQHKFRYAFEEAQASEEGTFDITISASADPNCDGRRERLVLRQTVTNQDGACQPYDGPYKYPAVEYFPSEDDSAAVALWAAWAGKGIWHPEGTVWVAADTESGMLAGSLLADTLIASSREPFETLLRIAQGVDKYYAANCALPSPLPPEAFSSCCKGVGPDLDGDSFCDLNSSIWEHPFWNAIGYEPVLPHMYLYDGDLLLVTPLKSGKELIRLVARADRDCDGKSNQIFKYGIADSTPGQCGVFWLKGWEIQGLID